MPPRFAIEPEGRAFATFFSLNEGLRDGIRRGISAMKFPHRTVNPGMSEPDFLKRRSLMMSRM